MRFASIELYPTEYTIELHRPGNAQHFEHGEQNREQDCGTNRDVKQHTGKAIPSHRVLYGLAVVPIALSMLRRPLNGVLPTAYLNFSRNSTATRLVWLLGHNAPDDMFCSRWGGLRFAAARKEAAAPEKVGGQSGRVIRFRFGRHLFVRLQGPASSANRPTPLDCSLKDKYRDRDPSLTRD